MSWILHELGTNFSPIKFLRQSRGILAPAPMVNSRPLPTLEFTSMVEKADKRVWCPKHQRMETPTWGAHDYQKLAKGLEGLNQIAINIDTFLTSEEGEKPNA